MQSCIKKTNIEDENHFLYVNFSLRLKIYIYEEYSILELNVE